ncbi:MAG: beta-ketoacyl-ACP synthase II [candidate division Zixibacteria bacterium]|nr:beta-ketoacyl-ACP synthase II [candidate division Zixibacteria bacterium]
MTGNSDHRSTRPRHRVVITGMGAITPIGNSVDVYWDGLLAGRSGAALITAFDTSQYPTRIAGEVKGFDPLSAADKKEARRLDRAELFALAASSEAVTGARLDFDRLNRDRCGVVIGSGIGGIDTFERQHQALLNQGPGRVSPFLIPMMIIDMCAGIVSLRHGLRGPNYATVSACASSAHAVADAARLIERGDADLMITGGAEATITPVALAGFCSARAMSTRNDEPERASRPFDADRDGFVMGEGAGILVLESLEHARKRGATILAEILGTGMSADAYHITAPAPQGEGAARAMKSALADAEIKPDAVDYINTHGTSTDLGDVCETEAIRSVFGAHADRLVTNSTKSMIGHLLGAAGGVELIACVKSIRSGKIHPTTNLDKPDPKCDLNYAANHVVERPVRVALSNSFGFGGHNVCLAVGAFTDNGGT